MANIADNILSHCDNVYAAELQQKCNVQVITYLINSRLANPEVRCVDPKQAHLTQVNYYENRVG